MNMRKMFARAGDECCQCENVANTKSNSQFSGDKTAADKLETRHSLRSAYSLPHGSRTPARGGYGNIGTGNTSTMATFFRLPAALKHGGK